MRNRSRVLTFLGILLILGAVGLWYWNKHVLHESRYWAIWLSLFLMVIGSAVLIVRVFSDPSYQQAGCIFAILGVSAFLILSVSISLKQQSLYSFGLRGMFCADWGSTDVDGVVMMDRPRYSIGDQGTLKFQFRNTGSEAMEARNMRIRISGLRSGFLVDMSQIPSRARLDDNALSAYDVSIDNTVLAPNEVFFVEVPVVALAEGNFRLGIMNGNNYESGGISAELRLGTNRCANLEMGSVDYVTVVP